MAFQLTFPRSDMRERRNSIRILPMKSRIVGLVEDLPDGYAVVVVLGGNIDPDGSRLFSKGKCHE